MPLLEEDERSLCAVKVVDKNLSMNILVQDEIKALRELSHCENIIHLRAVYESH